MIKKSEDFINDWKYEAITEKGMNNPQNSDSELGSVLGS